MTVVDDARAALERLIADRQAQIEDRDGVQADLDTALSTNAGLRASLDRLQQEFDAYKATHPDAEPPPPPPPDPEPATDIPGRETKVRVGMSSKATLWDQRVREVGSGLSARRIFADLRPDGSDQIDLVEKALAAGLLPCITYKAGGLSGTSLESAAKRAGDRLEALAEPIATGWHHEPFPEVSASAFIANSKIVLPQLKRDNTSRGQFLNGFLLDRQLATFESYCPASLFEKNADGTRKYLEWGGIDTYQAGQNVVPSLTKPWPGSRIPLLVASFDRRGIDVPLAIGEWNGFHADVINDFARTLLATPRVWLALVFNSDVEKGIVLQHDANAGDRLKAFQNLLADTRVYHPA